MMLDDATWELLSRHLDGDLSAAEEAALVVRLAAEPELRSALAELEANATAVAALAAYEAPPARLDELVEPLRRAVPPRRLVRPALAWLAAAATVVLGFTIGMEVFRQHPQPSLERPAAVRPATDARPTPFQLKPLPTASAAERDRSLGAVDRLLASPLPEPATEGFAPAPPEGPLDEAPRASEEVGGGRGTARTGAADIGAESRAVRQDKGVTAGAVQAPASALRSAAAGEADTARAVPRQKALKLEQEAPSPELHLPASADLAAGRYAVWVTLDAAGVVTDAEPRRGDEGSTTGLAAGCRRLVGQRLSEVSAGRHPAWLVVDAAAPPS